MGRRMLCVGVNGHSQFVITNEEPEENEHGDLQEDDDKRRHFESGATLVQFTAAAHL